jgi:DNA-binding Lrp family transcriptional regulator
MLDRLDRGLVHALHVDGRAPFSRIAAVLGVSPQTIIRRYQRLRAQAGLRVVGLPNPERTGQTRWIVRLTAAPATAGALARSLARRPDTSWVRLTSGGTEIVTIVTAPQANPGSPSLLLHDLPRTSSVTAVSAHYLLYIYLGGPTAWPGRAQALSPDQQAQLQPPDASTGSDHDRNAGAAFAALTAPEQRLLEVLGRDGRASYADPATATGWSQATVARQLAELRAHGSIFFDVEVDDTHLGIGTRALLWMTVAPAHLDQVATALASHHELAFVAATTGPSNLVAQALCPSPAALHHYLTRRLATLDGVTTIETAPVVHTVKAAGPLPTSTPHRPASPRAHNTTS